MIARGVISAAADLDIRVPEDLTVVGIGDFTGSADLTPALTTVRIDAPRVGQVAAEALLARMGAKPREAAEIREIPLELKVRRTSAVPSDAYSPDSKFNCNVIT